MDVIYIRNGSMKSLPTKAIAVVRSFFDLITAPEYDHEFVCFSCDLRAMFCDNSLFSELTFRKELEKIFEKCPFYNAVVVVCSVF